MNSEAIENTDTGFEGAGRTLQLVRAGSSQFGIFADEISAIAVWQQPTPLPHAPNSVLGVVSIQGRMLTVLDLATLFETPGDTMHKIPGRIIALRGDEQLALAIEELGETIQLPSEDCLLEPHTETASVLGHLHHEDREVRILDLNGLFPAALHGRQRRQRQF